MPPGDKPKVVKLEDVVAEGIRAKIACIHTAAPGTIQKYDRDNQSASVQLVVRGRRIDQRTRERSTYVHRPIVNVPVVFPGGGGSSLTFDLKKGDPVLVIFAERDISRWLAGGAQDVEPVDPRRHALGDAFCIPQVYPLAGLERDPNAVLEGATVLFGDDIRMGSALANDFIALSSKVEAHLAAVQSWMQLLKGIFDGHTHGGVLSGPSVTLTTLPAAPSVPDLTDPVGSEKVRSE